MGDPSVAPFFGVHNSLASPSILLCGSEAQRRTWLPRMRDLDVLGAYALTNRWSVPARRAASPPPGARGTPGS